MTEQGKDYRSCRRAFIAACDAAHVDAIARVQPGKADDGKPLFTDTAAMGDRLATCATLVVGNDADASAIQIELLKTAPPPGERLVLVHALNPKGFGGAPDPAWAGTTLTAVATEDLSKVTALTLRDLTGGQLLPLLQKAMPRAAIALA